MSEKVKKILNFALIFGTLGVVLYITFSNADFGEALKALQQVSPGWLVLCLAAYAVNVLSDTGALWYFLKRQGNDIGFSYALFVSITGTYYSDITPGASGGQPMQLFYLSKQNVPLGLGTSALTVKFMCLQAVLAVLATFAWIAHAGFVHQQIAGHMWILVVGYVYNLVVVLFALFLGTSRKFVGVLVHWGLAIGTRLHLIKNPDAAREKCASMQANYHDSFMLLLRRPIDLLIQLLFCVVQILAQMTIIVLLFKAFGLTGFSVEELIALGILQYISAAYTPLPGASGAQEGVFALYFANVFPNSLCLVALLLWRFFTYYMWLIIGAIITVWHGFHPFKRKPLHKKAK